MYYTPSLVTKPVEQCFAKERQRILTQESRTVDYEYPYIEFSSNYYML